MLHGAKWMFCSYVNGHSPDEQDENKAACLGVTHGDTATQQEFGSAPKDSRHALIKTNKPRHADTRRCRIIRLTYQRMLRSEREL